MPAPKLVLSSSDDLLLVDRERFPEVRGFAPRLRDAGELGAHLDFCNREGERIASFPWLDHADADLLELFQRMSSATSTDSFRDLEQSWEILIWRSGDEFFVAQGDGEPFGEFDIRFRVPAESFLSAWNELISSTTKRAFRSLEEALRHRDQVRALLLGKSGLEARVFTLASLEYLDSCLNRISVLQPRSRDSIASDGWICGSIG